MRGEVVKVGRVCRGEVGAVVEGEGRRRIICGVVEEGGRKSIEGSRGSEV